MPVVDKENPIFAVAAVASALLLASLLFVARVAVGARDAAAALPPIPKSGPLAEPRSSKQIGFPADQTKAVIPADNPQTPEKVALGEKLFFDGRLSADGTLACAGAAGREAAQLGGRGGGRSRRRSDQHERARPVSHDQEGNRHRLLQDAGASQRDADRAVFSRRLAGNPLGCDGPLQQRSRPE